MKGELKVKEAKISEPIQIKRDNPMTIEELEKSF